MDNQPLEDALPLQAVPDRSREIRIKIVGVGGAGSNAVDRLRLTGLHGVACAVVNTDGQALEGSPVEEKRMIGANITRGLSAGGDPDLGRQAAEGDREALSALFADVDLAFIVTGLGGGTGTGAAPVVAEIAQECGALVVTFATLPFSFEGGRRLKQAEDGLSVLRRCCEAVITLPNDLLLQEGDDHGAVLECFARADDWIGRGVCSIWAMLHRTGLINLDFSTLRQAFPLRSGKTLFGIGEGAGENPAVRALENLKLCPLLHTPDYPRKADRLLVNIVGGPDLTLARVNELMAGVTEHFGREAHVVLGAVIDESSHGKIEICVIGTTELSGRGGPVRRPAVEPEKTTRRRVETEPSSAEAEEAKANIQKEFAFSDTALRGAFDQSERNIFEGQDLDVPTYLRRGIKIRVE